MNNENKQSMVIGIRMSQATIDALDRVVAANGFKSRSECVKSLIMAQDAKGSAVKDKKAQLIEWLNNDSDVRAAVLSIIESARAPAYIGDKGA